MRTARRSRGDFTPVDQVLSWDSNGTNTEFCGGDTVGLVNAGYCFDDNTIGWDRGELMPSLRDANGDMAVSMVLAHEYGHAVAHQSGIANTKTATLVAEQQADCLAGVYMRWVAEGNSPRFTLSTCDGLNNLLAAMIEFRDPLLNEDDSETVANPHGSAFERVSAFQFGFTDGASSCAAIDQAEIDQRRGDLPVLLREQRNRRGGDHRALGAGHRRRDGHRVRARPIPLSSSSTPRATHCPDSNGKAPAVYCPSTNSILVDLPALQELGSKPDDGEHGTGHRRQHRVLHRGVALHDGVAARARHRARQRRDRPAHRLPDRGRDREDDAGVTTPDGTTITLTAGDVDEAVSGVARQRLRRQ